MAPATKVLKLGIIVVSEKLLVQFPFYVNIFRCTSINYLKKKKLCTSVHMGFSDLNHTLPMTTGAIYCS